MTKKTPQYTQKLLGHIFSFNEKREGSATLAYAYEVTTAKKNQVPTIEYKIFAPPCFSLGEGATLHEAIGKMMFSAEAQDDVVMLDTNIVNILIEKENGLLIPIVHLEPR